MHVEKFPMTPMLDGGLKKSAPVTRSDSASYLWPMEDRPFAASSLNSQKTIGQSGLASMKSTCVCNLDCEIQKSSPSSHAMYLPFAAAMHLRMFPEMPRFASPEMSNTSPGFLTA